MQEITVLILRWIARCSAVALAALYALMIAGEFASPHSGPPTYVIEWLGIGLLTLTCAGALLAWRWELTGALISLAALALFMIAIRVRADIVLAALATPAILFLADWATRRVLHTGANRR